MSIEEWEPRTRLGEEVKEGRITSIEEIFQRGIPIQEYEIVDILLPDLTEEVVEINLVQKMSSAGRKRRFQATMVVGNKDGYIGIAQAKVREIGPAIRHAIQLAKMNITPVRRGCGSWECRCDHSHSVPFKTQGRTSSVRIEIIPAPRGTGLAAGNVAKTVLDLAGIKDVWTRTSGDTTTTSNFAKATFEALKATYNILPPAEWQR
ncbi:MAG: 30S ribosomal protein S5 [Candidatus Heimdallarchaeota archaeon]|nr:30S ribosomal protein S5 [Candidatus Heimdallarchaeota archaeon]MDH5644598.1 30S ribosomal protein S5 [Candidatus Heimdallarchaeota archaeon]